MRPTPPWPKTLPAWPVGSRAFPQPRPQPSAGYAGANDDPDRDLAGHWRWRESPYSDSPPPLSHSGRSDSLLPGDRPPLLAATSRSRIAQPPYGSRTGARLRFLSRHSHPHDAVHVLHLPLWILAHLAGR